MRSAPGKTRADLKESSFRHCQVELKCLRKGATIMFENVTLEEAQASLPELIERLQPGAEIVITRGNQPVAELHLPHRMLPQPRFGSCQGALTILW
jgi:hypothetical protein